jgi:hypothetical protein
MDWRMDYMHHTQLHYTGHWHTQTSVPSLLQSPLAIYLTQWSFFSFPRWGPLIAAARAQLLPIDNSTNCNRGWRPFHTNLLVFSSQADFQLTTDNWNLSLTNQLLHATSLKGISDTWPQLDWWPRYITSGQTQQKTPPLKSFYCCHGLLPSDRLVIIPVGTCLPTIA